MQIAAALMQDDCSGNRLFPLSPDAVRRLRALAQANVQTEHLPRGTGDQHYAAK